MPNPVKQEVLVEPEIIDNPKWKTTMQNTKRLIGL